MPPRLFVSQPLAVGSEVVFGEAATRHAQVLRLQPGDALTLFDGHGGQWRAEISAMTKRATLALPIAHEAVERELPIAVTLALAMPAGDRMDSVVEKATELGAAAIQPLLTERSVLRLAGERAEKRRSHWQAIAAAACEQCGRNHVPEVRTVLLLSVWLAGLSPAPAPSEARWLLGWRNARPCREALADAASVASCITLSGPEGGLTDDEELLASARGFQAVSLGPRVLRADTAPLAALAALAALATTS
jgi:16S rRNA (uracil1498-N3)-methyltransferase